VAGHSDGVNNALFKTLAEPESTGSGTDQNLPRMNAKSPARNVFFSFLLFITSDSRQCISPLAPDTVGPVEMGRDDLVGVEHVSRKPLPRGDDRLKETALLELHWTRFTSVTSYQNSIERRPDVIMRIEFGFFPAQLAVLVLLSKGYWFSRGTPMRFTARWMAH